MLSKTCTLEVKYSVISWNVANMYTMQINHRYFTFPNSIVFSYKHPFHKCHLFPERGISLFFVYVYIKVDHWVGYTVAQLFEAQTGRSWVRFPMVSLEFFIYIILPAALWHWVRLSLLQKWLSGIIPGGVKGPGRRADNRTTLICRLSWNLGTSASWKPQSLSRPVMG
jgi:hypothetical protein